MVSLSEDPCDKAYNALSVYGGRKVSNATKTMDFAVCVKGMDFPTDDLSWRLAEWFEASVASVFFIVQSDSSPYFIGRC